eukprot:1175799-Prorocentrum_minimum.AAC.1
MHVAPLGHGSHWSWQKASKQTNKYYRRVAKETKGFPIDYTPTTIKEGRSAEALHSVLPFGPRHGLVAARALLHAAHVRDGPVLARHARRGPVFCSPCPVRLREGARRASLASRRVLRVLEIGVDTYGHMSIP